VSKKPNWSAMVSDSARMVVELLEASPKETQTAIASALQAGAEISVRMVVLPRPSLTVEMQELEGRRLILATVVLEDRAASAARH
jgi:hypothetical protein